MMSPFEGGLVSVGEAPERLRFPESAAVLCVQNVGKQAAWIGGFGVSQNSGMLVLAGATLIFTEPHIPDALYAVADEQSTQIVLAGLDVQF